MSRAHPARASCPGPRGVDVATSFVLHQRRYALQFRGSIVQPKDAPSPERWHEQGAVLPFRYAMSGTDKTYAASRLAGTSGSRGMSGCGTVLPMALRVR
eukprot:660950-Rhodomonas_salina.1